MVSICGIIINYNQTIEENFILYLSKDKIKDFFGIFKIHFNIIDGDKLDYPEVTELIMKEKYICDLTDFFIKNPSLKIYIGIIDTLKKINNGESFFMCLNASIEYISKEDSEDIKNINKKFINYLKTYMSKTFEHKQLLKKCYHTIDSCNCDKDIINSHSVSKSSSLEKIAYKGHIYNYKLNFYNFFDLNNSNPLNIIEPKKVGINEASTFYGFCKYHDNELFRDIDVENIKINEKTAFLLGYRAFVREYYTKELAIIEQEKLLKGFANLTSEESFAKELNNCSLPNFIEEMINKKYNGNLKAFIKEPFTHEIINNNPFLKEFKKSVEDCGKFINKYFNIFKSEDYSSVKYVAFKFSKTPDILFAGAAPILYDFEGSSLENDINNLENITINAVAYDNGGIIIFQWFDNDKINNRFIDSLIKIYCKDKNNICNILVQFIFVYIENIFIRMSWWDNLDTDLKNKLSEYNNLHNIHIPVYKSLIPDGNKYCDWGNVDIISNIYLS